MLCIVVLATRARVHEVANLRALVSWPIGGPGACLAVGASQHGNGSRHNSMLGKREVLHEWQKIWEGRQMCKDVGCSCDDCVSVFCTEMQGYVHEVMD
jgi:hypothetical protein